MHLEQYFCVLSLYLYPLRIVDEAGEDHDAEDEEEDQQHQLLGGGSEGLQEDLEPAGVTGEFEQPEDPDDAEELEHVRVLDVRVNTLGVRDSYEDTLIGGYAEKEFIMGEI